MNAFLYRRLLGLYPDDLRAEFGDEIVGLFLDELAVARGSLGIWRVWQIALRESLPLVVRGLMDRPTFAVPMLAAAFLYLTESPLIFRSFWQQGNLGLIDALVAVSGGAAIVAVTSWFVARRDEPANFKIN